LLYPSFRYIWNHFAVFLVEYILISLVQALLKLSHEVLKVWIRITEHSFFGVVAIVLTWPIASLIIHVIWFKWWSLSLILTGLIWVILNDYLITSSCTRFTATSFLSQKLFLQLLILPPLLVFQCLSFVSGLLRRKLVLSRISLC
jgi:hypothetical protein